IRIVVGGSRRGRIEADDKTDESNADSGAPKRGAHARPAIDPAAPTIILRHTLTPRGAGTAHLQKSSLRSCLNLWLFSLSAIRALLRRPYPKRIVKKARHAGHDRHVGQVKNVPAEAPAGGFYVKKHEIHDAGPVQPVDRIAERAADNKPERRR